ncbi:hypothetical protein AYI68_g7383 [Smittium mucronatum]|uniref:Secreted protein n=1 Tax=Smittium mucronatum TaxID=133383 RepID=A0A1R0GNW7_9FUNG|nr:hypothetical protein AYI68_g7383 [Smittium mucronatum]
MKFSILTGLVAVSTVFASQIGEVLNAPLEHENQVAGGQWQDGSDLNQHAMLQEEGWIGEFGAEDCDNIGGFKCLKPIPKSVATISDGNLKSFCVGGSTKPDYKIFKGVLCAFSTLKLDRHQPKNGVRACTKSKTGQKWCGTCFAHKDTSLPQSSIGLWNKLTKPQQASVCLDTIIYNSVSGFGANQCVNTWADSIYGRIGVHSYISN